MNHTIKIWEKSEEVRLRKAVTIWKQRRGFVPRTDTTDVVFALRMLLEKYREGRRELHYVFVHLEKAFNRVLREEIKYCMRKSEVTKKRMSGTGHERGRTDGCEGGSRSNKWV